MDSLFRCPLCDQPLDWGEAGARCPQGHCFDRSAQGYVHLLPANRKHSKNPGDDREMVAARSAFLDRGYYAPLLRALEELVLGEVGDLPAPSLLDSGCGEGYYTAGLWQALAQAGHAPAMAGVDLSKFALRRAARRLPQGQFAVASVYHLPVADGRMDGLVNVFSPLAAGEFCRVLRPGGFFCYVVPTPRHLWEMKQVLYPRPYENPARREDYPGFVWRRVCRVEGRLRLERREDILALFGMTPYAWKTPREGVERLGELDRLDTQMGFDLHWYQKKA